MTELIWEGKYAQGRKVAPPRIALPFQTGVRVSAPAAKEGWGGGGSSASLRYYEPDFVAVLPDGGRRLIETKGREDPDVVHEDRAARLWCENATILTGDEWRYLKVPQAGFDKLQPTSYADLAVFEVVER